MHWETVTYWYFVATQETLLTCPCRETAVACSIESIQFVSAPMSERRVLRIGVLTFTGTQECFVGRCFLYRLSEERYCWVAAGHSEPRVGFPWDSSACPLSGFSPSAVPKFLESRWCFYCQKGRIFVQTWPSDEFLVFVLLLNLFFDNFNTCRICF